MNSLKKTFETKNFHKALAYIKDWQQFLYANRFWQQGGQKAFYNSQNDDFLCTSSWIACDENKPVVAPSN